MLFEKKKEFYTSFKAFVVASNEHLKQIHFNSLFALTGTDVTFRMIPYNEEAELNLTKDEFYNVYFRIEMSESLPVEPSIRVLMTYPSGIIDNANEKYLAHPNINTNNIDRNTGRKNTSIFF